MTLTEEQRRQLIHLRLENADQALADAAVLLDAKSLRGASNRCYYAMFYAASALAIRDGKAFRKHSGLISYFHAQYMKTQCLPRDLGQMFVNAFDNRSQTDYQDDLTVSLDDVAGSLEDAKHFVAELKKFLGQAN
ncbi:MAG: HEPN domain-containing protein [Phycisphaerae bacterium]|nr:HEPN domain-containing protein [Phycisphaerae bacterium]